MRSRDIKARLSATPLVRTMYERAVTLRYRGLDEFATELDGLELRFATTDLHSRAWFHRGISTGGLHEPAVTRAMSDDSRAGRAFADVGAHLGWYSCVVGTARPDCRVTAFEMNTALVPFISENLRLNGRADAEVVNAAVGAHAGTTTYAAGSRSPGLRATSGGSTTADATVPMISLDEHFADQQPPDLIKIDVEGAEHEVLSGALELLHQTRPTMYLEIHPSWLPDFGASIDQVIELLRSLDYTLHQFDDHRGVDSALTPVRDPMEIPNNTMLRCVPR